MIEEHPAVRLCDGVLKHQGTLAARADFNPGSRELLGFGVFQHEPPIGRSSVADNDATKATESVLGYGLPSPF
jgi:hypothetical protein